MTALPRGLEQAFGVAAAELGLCTAAWLFVRELGLVGGTPLVQEFRDNLGRSFPVLDAVAAQWLDGITAPVIDPLPVSAACAGCKTVLVVGFEADFFDKLLGQLPGVHFRLLRYSPFGVVDWERILANYDERVGLADLNDFQLWAGTRTVVLTFLYGADAHSVHTSPAWLRLVGEDVRAQFHSFIGWDVLGRPMYVYPRWLVEVPRSDFSVLA